MHISLVYDLHMHIRGRRGMFIQGLRQYQCCNIYMWNRRLLQDHNYTNNNTKSVMYSLPTYIDHYLDLPCMLYAIS